MSFIKTTALLRSSLHAASFPSEIRPLVHQDTETFYLESHLTPSGRCKCNIKYRHLKSPPGAIPAVIPDKRHHSGELQAISESLVGFQTLCDASTDVRVKKELQKRAPEAITSSIRVLCMFGSVKT